MDRARISWTATLAVLLCGLAAGQAPPALPRLAGGPGELAAQTGHGGLTAGTSGDGRLVALRWPSPGYHDHLHYHLDGAGAQPPSHGLRWAVEVQGRVSWLDGPDWQAQTAYAGADSCVIETRWVHRRAGAAVTQRLGVAPEASVAAWSISLEGFQEAPRVFCYANLAPCARKLESAPVADWLLDDHNDFAVFPLGRARVVQFRPENPGRMAWRQARKLAAEGRRSVEAWRAFGRGVWVAAEGWPAAEAMCGAAGPDSAVLRAVERGSLAEAAPRTAEPGGGVCFALEIAPASAGNGAYAAGLRLGFGTTLEESIETLEGTPPDPAAIQEQSDAAAQEWLGRARLPEGLPPGAADACRRALLTLRTCMDASTGAMVLQASTQPPLALDWPGRGGWPTVALLRSGYAIEGLKRFDFYREAVAPGGEPVYPAFPPAALYADGTPAAPRFLHATGAAAWFTWSCLAAADAMPQAARSRFVERHANALEAAGDALWQWIDPATGRPEHAWDPELLRSARSDGNLVTHWMGLTSALELARMIGRERPAWRRAAGLLERRIERDWDRLAPEAFTGPYAPAWPRPESEALAHALDAQGKEAAAGLADREPVEAWPILARAAWWWRDDAARLGELRPSFGALCRATSAESACMTSEQAGQILWTAAVLYARPGG